jgi:hypothetical protein
MFSRAARRVAFALKRELRRGALLAAPAAALVVLPTSLALSAGSQPGPVAPTLPAYSGPAGLPMYEAAYKAVASLLDDLDHDDGAARASAAARLRGLRAAAAAHPPRRRPRHRRLVGPHFCAAGVARCGHV